MSTTAWVPAQHRAHLIQQLLESGCTSVADVPDPLLRAQLQTEFRTTADLLSALHERWTTLLERNLDIALDDEDPALAMGIAWDATVLCCPQLRRLLNAHDEHPLMRALSHRERVRLGQLTGLGAGGVALAVKSYTSA
ncbi:MAG TPA: hypothetical protein VFR99_02230 [Marmoricola sp.]|jgi:hypothetical protein|nr:hypothetical protein [Marmoricola sp.]